MLVNVIACIGLTFVVLAWIGWRYFIAPPVRPMFPQDAVTADWVPAQAQSHAATQSPVRFRLDFGKAGLLIRSPLWFALLPVAATLVGVLALSDRISLDPLSAADMERQKHIQVALNPEVLVPPPALPPSVFIGTERAGLETADRDWSRLNPEFRRMALVVLAKMEARGYPFVLLEGYRSPERQDSLADSLVHVTNARAFQSKHQYGLALDAAPIRNGRLVISEKDPWAMQAYLALGEEAEKAGLIWGGRWKLKDYGHIEASVSINRK